MCDCFDKVEANLKEKTGDPEASLNYMYAMPSFEKKPVIEATYRNKKKDGTFNKKESNPRHERIENIIVEDN